MTTQEAVEILDHAANYLFDAWLASPDGSAEEKALCEATNIVADHYEALEGIK
jgi:hypothetical protein